MFADKGRSEASSESGPAQEQMRRQEGADSSVTHSDVRECLCVFRVCLFISVKTPRVVVTVSDTRPKENIHLQERHNNSNAHRCIYSSKGIEDGKGEERFSKSLYETLPGENRPLSHHLLETRSQPKSKI